MPAKSTSAAHASAPVRQQEATLPSGNRQRRFVEEKIFVRWRNEDFGAMNCRSHVENSFRKNCSCNRIALEPHFYWVRCESLRRTEGFFGNAAVENFLPTMRSRVRNWDEVAAKSTGLFTFFLTSFLIDSIHSTNCNN